MELKSAFDDFILAALADGLAPKTVKWYSYTLGTLLRAFPSHDLEAITTKELRGHVAAQRERLAHDSAAGHVRALHRFFSWCSIEYKIDNPMLGIRRAPQAKGTPKSISIENFLKLYKATGQGVAGIRDRAILVFLLDTGVRLAGLLNLDLDNLFLDECYAVVTEKGNKTRRVPFSPITKALLQKWLAVRVSETGYVFVTIKLGGKLTESGLHEILKRLKRKAGVEGRVNPHAFRHAFAKEYRKAGGDTSTLKELMGHASIQTTDNSYGVFTDEELAEVYAKRSPVARILQGEV